jgi:hypothetical protein
MERPVTNVFTSFKGMESYSFLADRIGFDFILLQIFMKTIPINFSHKGKQYTGILSAVTGVGPFICMALCLLITITKAL